MIPLVRMQTLREWLVFDSGTVLTVAAATLTFVLIFTPWDKALRELWRTWKGR